MNTWVSSEDTEEAGIDAAHQMRKAMHNGTDLHVLNALLAADPDLFNAAWHWLTSTERRQWKELTRG